MPRPPCWAFVKGDLEGSQVPLEDAELLQNRAPELYRRVAVLYQKLLTDPCAQAKIDAHLGAAALVLQCLPTVKAFPHRFASAKHVLKLVVPVSDAPQLGNLPDLGDTIRRCLVHQHWGFSLLTRVLHSTFPSSKPLLKPSEFVGYEGSYPVLLHLVLALCLGLYPSTSKKPSFVMRAHFFARVHSLLTLPSLQQQRWIEEHFVLVQLAMSEYLSKILPLFFPVETDMLVETYHVQAFFYDSSTLYDQFRQSEGNGTFPSWGQLRSKAEGIFDKLHRLYKSKCRSKPNGFPAPPVLQNFTLESIRVQLESRVLVSYHDHRKLSDEYRILGVPVGDGPCLSQFLSVHPLPPNLQQQQLAVFEKQRNVCERQALMNRTLFVCLYCEFHNRFSTLRLSILTGKMVCEDCRFYFVFT